MARSCGSAFWMQACVTCLLLLAHYQSVNASPVTGSRKLLSSDNENQGIGDGRGKCQACFLGTCQRGTIVVNNGSYYNGWGELPTAKCYTTANCSVCTPHVEPNQQGDGSWQLKAWCACDSEGPAPCFPASASVRRQTPSATWERASMPQLRIGDTVECLVRDPVILENGRITSNPDSSRISQCQVFDYKKAMTNVTAEYVTISYERPGTSMPGQVTMTANHHILDANTGTAVMAGKLQAGDLLQLVSEDISTRVKVTKLTRGNSYGAYVPLLTKAGLLIVDGIVAYPSSGDCDVGLDAKHWGQYFLTAPMWQSALDKSNPKYGKTLFELGSHPEHGPVGAFTNKFYKVAESASKDGRHISDWAAVAAEMSREIAELSKVYSEAEALGVYDKFIKKSIS